MPLPVLPTISPAIQSRLIAGWRGAFRLWSVRLSMLSASLMAGWDSLPADVRADLPFAHRIAAALFVAVALARIVAQEVAA